LLGHGHTHPEEHGAPSRTRRILRRRTHPVARWDGPPRPSGDRDERDSKAVFTLAPRVSTAPPIASSLHDGREQRCGGSASGSPVPRRHAGPSYGFAGNGAEASLPAGDAPPARHPASLQRLRPTRGRDDRAFLAACLSLGARDLSALLSP